MTRLLSTSPRNQGAISSIITLARWRWRQSWLLLCMTCIGIIAAVMILCTAPLLIEVTTTAGLRQILRTTPESSQITLSIDTLGVSTRNVTNIRQTADQTFQSNLGSYLSSPHAQMIIQTAGYAFAVPHTAPVNNQLFFYSTDLPAAAPHIHIVQGRLPRENSHDYEVVLTPDNALGMHVQVGGVINAQVVFYTQPATTDGSVPPQKVIVPLHVVGLVTIDANDPYWHNLTLDKFNDGPNTGYPLLTSTQALLRMYDAIKASYGNLPIAYQGQGPTLMLSYALNPQTISFAQLSDLQKRLGTLQGNLDNATGSSNGNAYPYIQKAQLFSKTMTSGNQQSTLQNYAGHASVAIIPVGIIALQIILLILYFVSLMAELLVDRQADSIAVLRSRGASRRQVFGSLLTQCVIIALIALLIGPFCALLMVNLLAHSLLAAQELDALNIITAHPLGTVLDVKWYALATVTVAILTMALALYNATNTDVLGIRRAAARDSRQPFWQRIYLDVVIAVIALGAYGVSSYLTGNIASSQGLVTIVLITPLTLLAPMFLLIGVFLLAIRCYPLLLRAASQLAIRGRGAAPMLALAHMARSPRQAMRTTLLLALALSVTIFALIFNATQDQQNNTLVTHQVGADFSGDIPTYRLTETRDQMSSDYNHIPGVITASISYTAQGNTQGAINLPMQVLAVDTQTFANTIIWMPQDGAQPASVYTRLLTSTIAQAQQKNTIPAIVDAAAWRRLKLSIGSTFSIQEQNTVNYMVVGEVQHLPTVNDSLVNDPTANYTIPGGVLVDYQSYDSYQMKQSKQALTPNHIWLHTRSDAQSLALVRQILTNNPTLYLENLQDRTQIIQSLQTDPLAVTIRGMLFIGSISALLLALVGGLLSSWMSAHTRLRNFAVLRALGTAPQQIAGVLAWEQIIIYGAALLLGFIFGGWLTYTIVPTLTFSTMPVTASNDTAAGEFYALQHLFPTQPVIPTALVFTMVGLIALCIVVLVMMMRIVVQPSLGQVLRLNED